MSTTQLQQEHLPSSKEEHNAQGMMTRYRYNLPFILTAVNQTRCISALNSRRDPMSFTYVILRVFGIACRQTKVILFVNLGVLDPTPWASCPILFASA